MRPKISISKISNEKGKVNLLKVPVIQKLLLWKAFPHIVQSLILFTLAVLIIFGWGTYVPEGEDEELYAKLNVVCLLVWGIWWPLMIWTVVIWGRIWCMICPLELVSRIGNKAAGFFNLRKLPVNKLIKSGFIVLCLYALIQLVVAGTGLQKVPAYTAIFLSALILFPLIVGFFFSPGEFCRCFCPIALTLNTYSRGSMLAVRADSEDKCSMCKAKNCIKNGTGTNIFVTRSCPANIFPPNLKSNKDCLLCGQCIKSCSFDNLHLLLRFPFFINDIREKKASWILTAFVIMDSGFVLSELLEEWPLGGRLYVALPHLFLNIFNLQAFAGWIAGIWTLFIFPVPLWILLGIILKSRTAPEKITTIWQNFALSAVVISSAGHMIKSLIKITEWAGYLPFAFRNPNGENNIKVLNSNIILRPHPLLDPIIVLVISLMILGFALFFSVREEYIRRTQ